MLRHLLLRCVMLRYVTLNYLPLPYITYIFRGVCVCLCVYIIYIIILYHKCAYVYNIYIYSLNVCVCGVLQSKWRNRSSTEITWELDGSPVPCAKARRCVDRARACRKQMNTRSAGEQTNRTDQTRLQSYDLEWTCWLFPGPTGKLTKHDQIRDIFCLNTGQHQGSYLISQLQHALVDLVNRAMVKEASLDNFVSNISNKSYINIGCK